MHLLVLVVGGLGWLKTTRGEELKCTSVGYHSS